MRAREGVSGGHDSQPADEAHSDSRLALPALSSSCSRACFLRSEDSGISNGIGLEADELSGCLAGLLSSGPTDMGIFEAVEISTLIGDVPVSVSVTVVDEMRTPRPPSPVATSSAARLTSGATRARWRGSSKPPPPPRFRLHPVRHEEEFGAPRADSEGPWPVALDLALDRRHQHQQQHHHNHLQQQAGTKDAALSSTVTDAASPSTPTQQQQQLAGSYSTPTASFTPNVEEEGSDVCGPAAAAAA